MDVHIWYQQRVLKLQGGYYSVNVSTGLGICLHPNFVLVQQYNSQSFFIDYVHIQDFVVLLLLLYLLQPLVLIDCAFSASLNQTV